MKIHNTINRAKWRSGGSGIHQIGKGATNLLNVEEYMCCFGFRLLEEPGITTKQIKNKCYPDNVLKLNNIKLVQHYMDTEAVNKLVIINDTPNLTKKQREKQITEVAKELLNENWVFVGEYNE